jgi:putative serine protease PepD
MPRRFSLSVLLLALLGGFLGGAIAFGSLSYLPLSPSSAGEGPQVAPLPTTPPPLEPRASLEEVVEGAYDRVAPSVVHITSTVLRRDFFFRLIPQKGTGSGFIIDSRGYILTNRHVIQDAQKIQVAFPDGETYSARLVGFSEKDDIAVIKVAAPEEKLPPAPLGNSSEVRIGALTVAIGNPFGLDRTVTFGIVSALNRSIQTGDGETISGLIQTDAPINPGNSGGPLVDSRGRVIGINTAILSTSGGSIGIGFAIPINRAKEVAEALIERGEAPPEAGEEEERPWLGITGITIDREMSRALNLPVREGVLIAEVIPGSPADDAGLQGGSVNLVLNGRLLVIGGDILIEAGGQRVKSMDDLIEVIESHEVGDSLEIRYLREGREITTSVILGRRP